MLRDWYLDNYTTDWIKTKLIREIRSQLYVVKVSLKFQADVRFWELSTEKITYGILEHTHVY